MKMTTAGHVAPAPACRILAESSATFLGILPHQSFLAWNKQGGDETALPFSAAGSHRHRDRGAAPSSRRSSRWYWNRLPPPTPLSWKKPIMAASPRKLQCRRYRHYEEGERTRKSQGLNTHSRHME